MSGDPHWANVVLLCGFEGADASTAFVDESATARTLTSVNGAQIDTAQFRFGTSSAMFDGVDDRVTSPDSGDWSFGGGAFTVEGWCRFNGSLGNDHCLVSHWHVTGNQREWALVWRGGPATDVLQFAYSTTGSAEVVINTPAWTPTLGQWYHIAVDRSGNDFRIYVDGVMLVKTTAAVTLFASSTSLLRIGAMGHVSSTETAFLDGWLDEVRITKGVARYGSDAGFAVPTAAFERGVFVPGPAGRAKVWTGSATASLDGTSPTGAWSMYRDLLTSFVGGTRYTTATGVNQFTDQTGNSRHFTQATAANQPVVTTAGPNSKTCADFDGVNDALTTTGTIQFDDFCTGANGYVVVSFIADAITSSATSIYDNHAVIADDGGYFGLHMKSPNILAAYNYDGTADTATTTIATATHYVAEWRHQGGNVYVRINGGTEVSAVSGNTAVVVGWVRLGYRAAGTTFANIKIFELATWSTVPALATRDAIVANWMAQTDTPAMAWALKPVKVWSGASWVEKPLKTWNGSAWT